MSFHNRYMRGMTNGGAIMARRNDEPLTLDAIRAAVPSVFATEAHESRSARFVPIPTATVLDGLQREGFEPFFAQQSRTRIVGKREFTKHLVRLRHRGVTDAEGHAFEVILLNANDGTAAYQMIPGFFRFVCANGLFAGEAFEDVKVRHSGNAVGEVIEGAYRVLDDMPRLADSAARAQGLRLTPRQSDAFARAAHVLRFPDATEDAPAPIAPAALLTARRHDDAGASLWQTMNRVQENVIRGGQRYVSHDTNNRRRRGSVREVTCIDRTRAINRALWTLMDALADHAAA